jgi:hypothetical protein
MKVLFLPYGGNIRAQVNPCGSVRNQHALDKMGNEGRVGP